MGLRDAAGQATIAPRSGWQLLETSSAIFRAAVQDRRLEFCEKPRPLHENATTQVGSPGAGRSARWHPTCWGPDVRACPADREVRARMSVRKETIAPALACSEWDQAATGAGPNCQTSRARQRAKARAEKGWRRHQAVLLAGIAVHARKAVAEIPPRRNPSTSRRQNRGTIRSPASARCTNVCHSACTQRNSTPVSGSRRCRTPPQVPMQGLCTGVRRGSVESGPPPPPPPRQESSSAPPTRWYVPPRSGRSGPGRNA